MPLRFFNYLLTWLICSISPVRSITSLTLEIDRGKSIERIFSLWLPSILIGLAVQIPVTHMFGVEWNNTEFFLMLIILSMMMACAGGVFTHIVMRALGLKSQLPCTLALYTVTIIYLPIANIFLLRNTYKVFNAIYVVKQSGVLGNVIESGGFNIIALNIIIIRFLRELRWPTGGVVYIIDNIITDIAGCVGILCLAVFAEMSVKWYGNTRYETYLAVSVSQIVGFILVILIYWPIWTFTLYSFIDSAK
jgi:hypothetical protein